MEEKRSGSKDTLLSCENLCHKSRQKIFFPISHSIGDQEKYLLTTPMTKNFVEVVRECFFECLVEEVRQKQLLLRMQ